MYSQSIQKLIDLFSKFPTIGPRTAARFVFYLMRAKNEEVNEFLKSIVGLKKNVKICSLCFNSFEGDGKYCPICSNPGRDKTLLCVVVNETDLAAIEKTKKFKGFYFVLGGQIIKLRAEDIKKLRIKELEERLKNSPEVGEIILAFNSNTEGEATALYLERILKPFNKKISRLGRGLPVGGELEYADEETLSSALEGRK
ncbi:MAG: recombination mediator RecR [Candidatus Wildermuthbacteria bacterium]|nr:recombination mediator RecR [Candidatus Wildermuthbacteria bacterium]